MVFTKAADEIGMADAMRLSASFFAPFLLLLWGFGKGALFHLFRIFALFGVVVLFFSLGFFAVPLLKQAGLVVFILWLLDAARIFMSLIKALIEEVEAADEKSGPEYYPM